MPKNKEGRILQSVVHKITLDVVGISWIQFLRRFLLTCLQLAQIIKYGKLSIGFPSLQNSEM